jgi:hypothetical protein
MPRLHPKSAVCRDVRARSSCPSRVTNGIVEWYTERAGRIRLGATLATYFGGYALPLWAVIAVEIVCPCFLHAGQRRRSCERLHPQNSPRTLHDRRHLIEAVREISDARLLRPVGRADPTCVERSMCGRHAFLRAQSAWVFG